jgi:hypothetical protein
MAVLPNQILRKKIYAKRMGRHYVGIYYTSPKTAQKFGYKVKGSVPMAKFIYYTPLFREQKFFMKVKGIASQGGFGVYILSGLLARGI